ncbi:MAG: dihydrodipicolinate synthase family protein [Planctomycetes bacterium]|nr:dihydrodipicolinate synthase family protein [Planctomycetota bacterium]
MADFDWKGVFAATLCPFLDDEEIDEPGLARYAAELSRVDGLRGLVVNGHTGEIMSLLPEERERVTRIAKEAAGDCVKIVSGVSAEGSREAIAHARAALEAGADAILLMPPHHWLRFGRDSRTAVGFIRDVAEAVPIPVIVHQYPAWTKAGYTLSEMLEMVRLPSVVSIKMGTRDMARWGHDYRALKASAPDVSIVTCHDEYLLPTLLDGCDGVLVGFAGFAPEPIVALTRSALSGDLAGAYAVQEKLRPLARIIYRFGEPTGDAHQRMKCARWLLGTFPSRNVRRPLRPLAEQDVARIRSELSEAGFTPVN